MMTVPQRLSFSAQLSNCNVATCWHIELSILGLLHISMSVHWSNSCSCSFKFFQLKITLGRILAVACPTKEKLMPTMACFCGIPFLTDIPKLASVKTRMLTHRPNSYRPQFSCASLGWSFCHENEHHGIDQNFLGSGHHESRLFHKRCLSLHS